MAQSRDGDRDVTEGPNPSGLCLCGCGRQTPIATSTDKRRRRLEGHHCRFVESSCATRARMVDARDRLLAKVDKSSSANGCWLWTATLDRKGYGRFYYLGRMRQAHIPSYELHVGVVPDGLELDHLCRVRACVNPAHLEPVTHAENTRRTMTSYCQRGHAWTDENTYFRRDNGKRQCRACRRARDAGLVS